MWKKQATAISLFILIMILASTIAWYIMKPKQPYQKLWEGEPELLDPRFHYTGKNSTVDLSSYVAVESKIRSLLRKGAPDYLQEVYVHHSPDWQNGTAYIILTDISPDKTKPILDLFSPHTQENIRFLKALAPLWQIEEWENALLELCTGPLIEKGVQWTSIEKYYDGRILLAVEEITPQTIDILKKVIKGNVPPGILVLWESGKIIY